MNRLRDLVKTDARKDRILPTVRKALPFRIDPTGAREAALLLHGLTGNPSELLHLGRALAEAGYAVHAPRHPGHGTSRSDLLKTRAEDWIRHAFDAYLDLSADYRVVHVVGHSMGGLLAASTAISFQAPKLVLLAPAFLVSMKGVRWTMLCSRFAKVRAKGRPIADADSASEDQRRLHAEYWADELLQPAAELFRLSMLCRRGLDRLRSRTLVIAGEKDPVVPPAAASLVARFAFKAETMDTRVMAGAGHLFPFDERADETARLVLTWMGPAGSGA